MLDEVYLQNLDGFASDDELLDYAKTIGELELTGEDDAVRNKLFNYAHRKAQAMKCRAQGTVATAMQLEAACDAIYQSLPDWAKW